MYIKGVTFEQMQETASYIGVKIRNTTRQPNYGQYVQGRLFAKSDTYRKLSSSKMHDEKRTGAVCWHGHRDFMKEVFRINPHAVIKSCKATYKSYEDFLNKYRDTAIETGLGMLQRAYIECCQCGRDAQNGGWYGLQQVGI